MNVRQMAALCVLGTCLCWVTGCAGAMAQQANPSDRKVEKEFDLMGKTVVVIPFREERRTYFESQDGADLAQLVGAQLERRVTGVRVVSADPIRKNYDPQTLENVEPTKLGATAGAQMVMVGNLRQFTLQDPGVIGMLHGTCIVDLTLFDAKTGKPAWSKRMTINYPDYGPGVPEPDTSRSSMREMLLAKTADAIAKQFYMHLEPNRRPPMQF